MNYAELQVTTNFSFLRGASHPDELLITAATYGLKAVAVTDWNSLAGIVQAYAVAEKIGLRLVVGCRIILTDGLPILIYPTDKAAYARLCRMLTIGKGRAGKGKCDLNWQDLVAHSEGMIGILLPQQADDELKFNLTRFQALFGKRGYMALTLRRRPNDALRLFELSEMALVHGVATVVTNDVLFHLPRRRILQDVMTCIREKTTIDRLGFKRQRFADRHFKQPEEMQRLFAKYPEALQRTMEIVDQCRFSLRELQYQYPDERGGSGLNAQELLEQKTWEGAEVRYPEGVSDKVTMQLRHELDLIGKLNYASYFLTVNNIVSYAKSAGILCQGRGSAANSAVCYVLGITSIDPERNNLLFERFVSLERHEPPDIDVDFDSDRREEVIQWIYRTYGLRHAALTAVVSRYRTKGALRDVGKALGLPEDVLGIISEIVWPWGSDPIIDDHLRSLNLNLDDGRLRLALHLADELRGFPRHLSQHPGGFVLTRDRLDDLVPIEPAAMEDRQVIEWDKDDIDTLKFMKVDILGLGMLGCLQRSFDYMREYKAIDLTLATVPAEDRATYDMICRADTMGVFQIESRAQMSMLPRLRPRTFYDLVIEVSLVRPGPIQGDMVHPYLRRRNGEEKVDFPSPALREILGKTLGVPLFQEQAMSIAIKCAGFEPSEADELRRAMATFKRTGGVTHFKDKFINGMLERGYAPDFVQRCFKQIEGFGSYGFPESHAASFAILAYISSWMKCHHPEVFCCALLNAQPMGFYQPAQLVQDAQKHGVEIRPIDVNYSHWDSTLEPTHGPYHALRLGMNMVGGLHNEAAAKIIASRGEWPYETIDELWLRAHVPASALQLLADADAFGSLKQSRREAFWAVKGLAETPLPLFAAMNESRRPLPEIVEQPVLLRHMSEGGEVIEDYRHIGLTLRHHPLSFIRQKLGERRVGPISQIRTASNGSILTLAGLVLVRQRPGTAKGVLFLTIEDETGHANLIVWPDLFDRQRRLLLSARLIACRGKLQREGGVIHLVAREFYDFSDLLGEIAQEQPNENKLETLEFGSRNFC